MTQARADLDKAATLRGHQDIVFQGYGMLAMRRSAYADAAAAFSRAVELRPSDDYSLRQRAYAYYHLLKTDKALDDAAELARLFPADPEIHALRIELFVLRKDADRAIAETDALIGHDADTARAHALRAATLGRLDRRAEAEGELAKSLAIAPNTQALLARAKLRESSDRAEP